MRGDRVGEAALVLVAAVVPALLLPLGPGLGLSGLDHGLLVVGAGFGGAVLVVAAAGAADLTGAALVARLRALALWAACAAAMAGAVLAVVFTAQTLSLRHIVTAQLNTLPYAMLQPAAAAVCLGAAALAGDARALAAVLGRPAPLRRAALAATVALLSGLMATLFLAGDAGPVLPGPLWLLLKTLLMAATLLALHARLERLGGAGRLLAAWSLLLPIALANLAVTVAVIAR